MGEQTRYSCINCDFEIVDNHLMFFYNDKTKRINHFMPLMLTGNVGEDSTIRGVIKKTYCNHCDNIIEIYTICYYPKDKDKNEVIDIVNKGLRKNKNHLLIKFEDYEDSKSNLICCPNCDNKINDEIMFDVCPKCNGSITPLSICID